MTDNILFNIFVLSLMCSGIALLIIVIRKLFGKKSGAWWRSIIWLIMLIRLCVPVLIQSPIGVMNNFTFTDSVYEARESEDSFAAARQTHTAVSPVRQLAVNKNESDYALTENDIPTRGKIDWLRMANYLYAAGFVISAGLLSARIFVLNKRISKLKICRDKNILSVFHQIKKQMGIKRKISLLIETDDDAPALSGMLFPNVIIPESAMNITNVSELKYIFIHELTHYKRCDVAKLWLLELTICIHWFNPILHLLKRTIVQDFELACDERVLSSISNSEYAKYGNVLVNFSTRKKSKSPVVVTTNFVGRNGKNLRERLVMIKMFNKKKIIIFGIVLVATLSVALVSCTSVINKDSKDSETAAENKVEVKYLDYYYTSIPEQYLEIFLKEFKKAELVEAGDDAFSKEMYGDFKYKFTADSRGYMLYRNKDNENEFYLVHGKGKDEPWDYFIFESETFASLLTDIEKEVLKSGELIKYDKESYEEVYGLINGEVTLEDIISSKNWVFYEGDNNYLLRAIFPDENEYHVTLSSDMPFGKRYLDYGHDNIRIYNADKDTFIDNPTIDEYTDFLAGGVYKTKLFDGTNESRIQIDDVVLSSFNALVAKRPAGSNIYAIEQHLSKYPWVQDGEVYRIFLFDNGNEYKVVLKTNGYDISKPLTYDYCELIIENLNGDWKLINPDRDDIDDYLATPYYQQLNTMDDTVYGHDINAGNGHIIETLMAIAGGELPIGDLTEEFNLNYDDNAYRLTLFTTTDLYEIELIDGGAAIDGMLDYTKSQLNIVNHTDGWTLNNPTSEEIKNLILNEYYEQREAWRQANAESRYSGNFIQIASTAGLINIKLDSDTAAEIISELKDGANESIIINEYKGTANEFHMKGLEIFLEGMGYEYPVPLWINAEGTKAIGFANEPIPVSETAYDLIAAIAAEQAGYEEGYINDIFDLISVELVVNDISQGTVTETKDVKAIEDILTGSEIMNGIGGCPFGAKLIMIRADGQVIEAVLPVDSCGYFILGTATCYQYDRADSSDNREYTQQDLLKYFGMTEFSDANKGPAYEFSEQDIKSAQEIIEKYFKARLDKDAQTYVKLMHPDRNITLERAADGSIVLWESEQITLLEIKAYDAQMQRDFDYHKDNNDGKTIIFKVDFNVAFPDGNTNSAYNEGVYSDWAMILVRDDLNGEWYIYDQGY